MNQDDLNTLLYFAIRESQEDEDLSFDPKTGDAAETKKLLRVVAVGLITLLVLPLFFHVLGAM